MQKKIMFSIHVGDSIAHILRTRSLGKYLISHGYDVLFSIPQRVVSFLQGYIGCEHIAFNKQDYSVAKLTYQINTLENFYEHVVRELEIYRKYKPHAIIGDFGLIPTIYKPDVPVLKILNRFYVEICEKDLSSPFSAKEKTTMIQEFEKIGNYTRSRIGINTTFYYHELLSSPVFLNGSYFFINDINKAYKQIGINLTLKVPNLFKPDLRNCFVALGTGFVEQRIKIGSMILKHLESRFKKIYVSYGTVIDGSNLYCPKNAIMKPIFKSFPKDIGILFCHGSYGMIHLGAVLGVPIVAYPFQVEQYSNAYQMERLGIGVNVATYNNLEFKGLFQEFQINWDKFEKSLNNLKNIRKIDKLEDKNLGKNQSLCKSVEEFLFKL